MKVNVTDAENSQKRLTVEIPRERVDEAEEKELKKYINTAKLPGFRPGKAPKEVVKKQYNHKIKSAALESTVNDAIRDALISNNISPINTPNVTDVILDDDKPLSFTVTVDVYPDINLEKTEEFEVTRLKAKISDEDVDKVLDDFRERNSYFDDAPEEKAAENSDQCFIDISAAGEGIEAGSYDEKNIEVILGFGQIFKEVESELTGMKKGEVKTFDFTYPEGADPSVAGKQAAVTVTLNSLKVKAVPELNDEFAKIVNPETETLEALRAKISGDMEREYAERARAITFDSLLDKLIAVNKFDVPLSLVEEQADTLYKNTLNEFYYRYGIDPNISEDGALNLRERQKPYAEMLVRRALMINAIAMREKYDTSAEEIRDAAADFAQKNSINMEYLNEQMKKDSSLVSRFQNDIISNKVFDYLSARNTVEEREVTLQEFNELSQGKRLPSGEAPAETETSAETETPAGTETADEPQSDGVSEN
jgi:trigger factor